MTPQNNKREKRLTPYLSPLAVWALAFGCAVGWGSFVMPGTTFLPQAGPVGAAVGLFIGAGIMVLIGFNYYQLMKRYPGAGGAYTYAKRVLGSDHGFLCAWMMILTYAAIIWANSTALSLIVRDLFGEVFCFGFSYSIAGYTIYFGEVLLSVAALAVTGLLVAFFKQAAKYAQIICAALLFVGVTVCFIATVVHNGGFESMMPAFSEQDDPAVQVLGIVMLSPWAFIGFESVSHSTGELKCSVKKTMPAMTVALVTGVLTYVMLTLCAAMARPDGYASWGEYIGALARLDGVESVPTFYAAREAMGSTGLITLGIAAICGVVTGLIANYTALSRLLYSVSVSDRNFKRLGKLSKNRVPYIAVLCVMCVSFIVPLFGRTAIGWIVDVTTIGAALIYAYTSMCALVTGKREKNKKLFISGIVGVLISVGFAVVYLMPNLFRQSKLATESYMMLIIWSLLGMVVFRVVIGADKSRRFGKSEIVWTILLLMVMVVSAIWIQQTLSSESTQVARDIVGYQKECAAEAGLTGSDAAVQATGKYISTRLREFGSIVQSNIFVQTALIACSSMLIFSIFSIIKKREKHIEKERITAEQNSRAKSTFLSNMSHDIRTPMNAITGYTALALKEDVSDKTRDYLEKIDTSGRHLLSLINDILDMSRIESGKMELDNAPADLESIIGEVQSIFAMQMHSKHIDFTTEIKDLTNRYVVCDKNRINRILLNLLSNACKFTPDGGKVSLTLKQTAANDDSGVYELCVADTGIGMSPEFSEHIFDAFERERTQTVSGIQGTGLGMAITKNLVELMGGSIDLQTEKDKGTRFTITLPLQSAEEADVAEMNAQLQMPAENHHVGAQLLLAEDNPVNSEIACEILRQEGYRVDTAENGKRAVEMLASAPVGTYQLVLMDILMPVMDGLEATRSIRALEGERGKVPVIAMTANTFEDDRRAAKEAGMNGYVGKPFSPDELLRTIEQQLEKEDKQ